MMERYVLLESPIESIARFLVVHLSQIWSAMLWTSVYVAWIDGWRIARVGLSLPNVSVKRASS